MLKCKPDLVKSYNEGLKEIQLNNNDNGFIATIEGVIYKVVLNKDCEFEYFKI